jgi:glycosyltransferase involved in cell wall biosynthesis
MVILQAMAASVPVVSTDVGGIRYLVADGETGYIVPPRAAAEMAEKLGNIVGNEKLSQAMAAKSKMIAEERFRATVVARKTREIYLRATDGRAAD